MSFHVFVRSACLAATLIALGAQHAGAQAATVPQAAISGQAGTSVEVLGFRSARFGMDEAAVRKAATGDFDIKAAQLVAGENPSERTKILTARAPGVLPDGGAADVSYVLGHASKKLTQVSVLWSAGTDPTIDGDKLVANGNVLRNYFLSAGYEPRSIVTDVAVPEGLLMFRGSDAKGRMAVLLLRGNLAASVPVEGANEPAPPVLTPTSLLLAYIENPQKPDVFTLKPGQF